MRKLAGSLLSCCVCWAGLLTDVFNRNATCGSGGLQRTAARHHARRPVDQRAAGAQAAVRAARALDVPGPQHQQLSRLRDHLRSPRRLRPGGVRTLGRRPDRGGHRERGTRHGRRGLPRAGPERGRLLPSPARLLHAGAGDLRRPRRPARLRRGQLRLRSVGPHVRRRAFRLPARHHHLRQGHHLGLRAPRRDDRQRAADGAIPRGQAELRARLHVRRPPRLDGRRTAQPAALRGGEGAGERPRQRSGVPGHPGAAARPPHRRRRARGRLLLRHRARQGQGHQGVLHR